MTIKQYVTRARVVVVNMAMGFGLSTGAGWCAETGGAGQMRAEFEAPPFRYQTRP